ncbi:MAG: amidohydrolase [Armatimonadetes bacterium]|nr:amidohydrolase [Armatimonadota bacterium]MDW8152619.1 DUF6282 family protein [Armatimonadota bacterium]
MQFAPELLERVREEATEGMIDFHVHTFPDTFDRTVDAVEAAQTARALGMRAVVLKGGAFETVTRAAQAQAEVGGGIRVFGGVVLNWPMGGLNPAAVEAMVAFRGGGAEGVGKVVWMPSIHARNHHERFGIPQPGVEVFDGTRLLPAAREILRLCAEYDLVLQTGHLSAQEALALIREARAAGVERIVCTHADYDPIRMTIEEQREAARLGAYIEHAYCGVFLGPDSPVERFRTWQGASVEQMAAAIKAVGAERCILSSDLGASPLPRPAEGYLAFVQQLRALGITDRALDRMGRRNPAELLGL